MITANVASSPPMSGLTVMLERFAWLGGKPESVLASADNQPATLLRGHSRESWAVVAQLEGATASNLDWLDSSTHAVTAAQALHCLRITVSRWPGLQ
jgi:hypothetical protein